MVFILPDEGISPQSLIDTPEKIREVFEGGEEYMGEVVWQIPKFDFTSSLDLKETLNHLGVTSAFTLIEYAGEAIPNGRADMCLTRPFLYGITGTNGALLFVGICENPSVN
ncbi:MAG: serpin family protein [Lachnospiraceae bacterium]|jgi:serine protease inhibitor|nr:serpin family protein [Lachnospiraceae bacterium]